MAFWGFILYLKQFDGEISFSDIYNSSALYLAPEAAAIAYTMILLTRGKLIASSSVSCSSVTTSLAKARIPLGGQFQVNI